MQYCIKIFNSKTNELVGYYKEIGRNCITAMPNGTKYFTEYEKALEVANELTDGFLRDKDGHWYTAICVVWGNSKKQPPKEELTNTLREEEKTDAVNTIIRQSSSEIRGAED